MTIKNIIKQGQKTLVNEIYSDLLMELTPYVLLCVLCAYVVQKNYIKHSKQIN